MKLSRFDNLLDGEVSFRLTFTLEELERVDYRLGDGRLFAELATADGVTVSDTLLGLELVARRIEEQDDARRQAAHVESLGSPA